MAVTRCFAFIRAINTGNRRLTNDALVAPFVALGLDDVAAYQAAGNITFGTDTAPDQLTPVLEAALAEAYGFDAPTFVRTGDELRALVAATPFSAAQLAATEGRVQCAFLRSQPTDEQLAEVARLCPADDAQAVAGAHWWWLPRAGISTSTMPVDQVEQVLGPMTMRTAGTLQRMLKKFPD